MTRVLTAALVAGLVCCGSPAVQVGESYLPAANGSRLFLRTMGAGADTVVVLHGGPGLHGGYLVQPLQDLARRHTVLLHDQRGRGRSDPVADSSGLTVQDDVADLEALRAHLKLSRFDIIAHHYGALVAVDYIRSHPRRVNRLVLAGPMVPRALYRYDLAFRPADSVATASYRSALDSDLAQTDPLEFCRRNWGFLLGSERVTDAEVVRAVAPGLCEPSPLVKARTDAVNMRVATALGNWDYRSRVAGLELPVLVIAGDRDRILTHAARTWAYQAAQGRIVLLGAAAQFPWIGSEQRFSESTDAFLAGRWPSGAERPLPDQVASPASVTDSVGDLAGHQISGQ